METGANDVLLIRGDRERLIPFIQGHYVKRVDLEEGLMVVDWDPDY
jgi:16S rRNA processing protein RimM